MPTRSPHVLFLTKYGRIGASSRYRSFQYIPYLESQGITCSNQAFFDDAYLEKLYSAKGKSLISLALAIARRLLTLLTVSRYDLLIIEKELIPYCPALFERLFSLFKVPYVVDYDDALFHQYDNHKNLLVRILLGGKISTVMRHATAVIGGNNYLYEYARRSGAKEVYTLPTAVDLNNYPVKTDCTNPEELVVGWIGSPITSSYLKSLAPVFETLNKEINVRLISIGSRNVSFPGIKVEEYPWSEDTEAALIMKCDVGVMPLTDAPWERGKCGLKLIQYMACGLPVVGSPVGANKNIISHGENGYLALDKMQWTDALLSLHKNREMSKSMGLAGRKTVEERYSLDAEAPQLFEIIKKHLNR